MGSSDVSVALDFLGRKMAVEELSSSSWSESEEEEVSEESASEELESEAEDDPEFESEEEAVTGVFCLIFFLEIGRGLFFFFFFWLDVVVVEDVVVIAVVVLLKKFKLEGILVAFCVVEEADRDVEAALSLRICAPYFL